MMASIETWVLHVKTTNCSLERIIYAQQCQRPTAAYEDPISALVLRSYIAFNAA